MLQLSIAAPDNAANLPPVSLPFLKTLIFTLNIRRHRDLENHSLVRFFPSLQELIFRNSSVQCLDCGHTWLDTKFTYCFNVRVSVHCDEQCQAYLGSLASPRIVLIQKRNDWLLWDTSPNGFIVRDAKYLPGNAPAITISNSITDIAHVKL